MHEIKLDGNGTPGNAHNQRTTATLNCKTGERRRPADGCKTGAKKKKGTGKTELIMLIFQKGKYLIHSICLALLD